MVTMPVGVILEAEKTEKAYDTCKCRGATINIEA